MFVWSLLYYQLFRLSVNTVESYTCGRNNLYCKPKDTHCSHLFTGDYCGFFLKGNILLRDGNVCVILCMAPIPANSYIKKREKKNLSTQHIDFSSAISLFYFYTALHLQPINVGPFYEEHNLQKGYDISAFRHDLRQKWSFTFICGFIAPPLSLLGSPS